MLQTCQSGPHHWFKDGNMMQVKSVNVRPGTFADLLDVILGLHWAHRSGRMKARRMSGRHLHHLLGTWEESQPRVRQFERFESDTPYAILWGPRSNCAILAICQGIPVFLKPALFLECFSAISIPYNPQKHGHTDIPLNGSSSTIRISINHQQGGMAEKSCAKKTDEDSDNNKWMPGAFIYNLKESSLIGITDEEQGREEVNDWPLILNSHSFPDLILPQADTWILTQFFQHRKVIDYRALHQHGMFDKS